MSSISGFFGSQAITTTVQEARAWSFADAWGTFHWGLLLMTGGFITLAYRNWREEHPAQIFVLIWSAVILYSTIAHIRYRVLPRRQHRPALCDLHRLRRERRMAGDPPSRRWPDGTVSSGSRRREGPFGALQERAEGRKAAEAESRGKAPARLPESGCRGGGRRCRSPLRRFLHYERYRALLERTLQQYELAVAGVARLARGEHARYRCRLLCDRRRTPTPTPPKPTA